MLVDRLSKEIMEECASNFVLCNFLSCVMISERNSTQNLNAVDFDKNSLVHKMHLMECE